MSLEELKKAEEMATDLATYLEEIGEDWRCSDAYHIALQLQELIDELGE